MRRGLFVAPSIMKRITKDRSVKVKSTKEENSQNKPEQRVTRSRTTGNSKQKVEENLDCKDEISREQVDCKEETVPETKAIKEEVVEQTETEEIPTKFDLSQFAFKREKRPVLPSSSPKKREHIKVEYDDEVSTAKVKKEEVVEEESKVNLKDGKPLNWEAVLENLRKMRQNRDAPVDSMGCHKCPDENEAPEIRRYQALISLMLSSQTKDQVTHAAMTRLKEHGCTVEKISQTSDEKLGELIYPVGFWKTKVKYIKKTTEMLKNDFEGDIPNTAENLCKLPGVGPKMAHLCMQTAWNEVTGIGVDTHVHRICNRLGWVKSKTPEGTRKTLEDWLPHELWSEVNHLLVGFGQQICTPLRPQCATCLNCEICPFGVKNLRGKLKMK